MSAKRKILGSRNHLILDARDKSDVLCVSNIELIFEALSSAFQLKERDMKQSESILVESQLIQKVSNALVRCCLYWTPGFRLAPQTL